MGGQGGVGVSEEWAEGIEQWETDGEELNCAKRYETVHVQSCTNEIINNSEKFLNIYPFVKWVR